MTQQSPRNVFDLAARFADVDTSYGPVPIWWWSGARLERDRLRWQMEQLVAGGVTQAVVMCLAPRGPLYGSLADDPPFLSEEWWEIFLHACEDAYEIGFKFWLYDQYGFSGANFQGQLVAAHPTWAGQEIDRVQREVAQGETVTLRPPAGSTPIAAYVVAPGAAPTAVALAADGSVSWSGGAGRLALCYARTRGFDYYDPAACAALIDTVLGEFRRRADKWFGPVITGLFQDELPHMPTWGKEFAASFAGSHGYDLVERIACLWEGDDDRAASVRRDYHAHRATLARESFFVPYGTWAADAGLTAGFDQQTPAREGDPVSAADLYGDYLRTHGVYSAPGSDHWGDPKVHSSLAHANGQPRTWIEAFHSSGWGGTLEETYDWLGPFLRRGANLYDPHAVYYATVGGWWEWAPPSTCWRQPYWPDYKIFSDAVTRLCALTSAGSLVADTVLVFPTSSVQADLPLGGAHPQARRTSDVYHQLNGSTSWFDERPGVLDRAGRDYEIFDEQTLAGGEIDGGVWRVAGGAFRNIVLPAATALDRRFAGRLAEFATGGGRVVCVGPVPDRIVGADSPDGAALAAAVNAGRIDVVDDAADVPGHLMRGPVSVESDAPFMLRRYGDTHVLLLVAHDGDTGTHMPVFAGSGIEDRIAGTFSWQGYWTSFSEQGYTFSPVGDRRARVRVTGVPGHSAQRWDPRSGERVDLQAEQDGDELVLDVAFADGPMAVVVLGTGLPEATRTDPGEHPDVVGIDGDWEIEAHSTLDNRWADLGDPADRGILPIQVWRLEHRRAEAGSTTPPADGWTPALATFGPYLRVTDPQPTCGGPTDPDVAWRPYEVSLSRGIRKDPLHFTSLGPKGTVPEEFLRWDEVGPDQWVAFAATLDLPEGAGRHFVLGAAADRRIFLDGTSVEADGTGYWTRSPVADGARHLELQVWLRRGTGRRGTDESAGELRATFAVVTDLERFSRPEWLEPADGIQTADTVRFSTTVDLDVVPDDTVVQIGSEGPCSIIVNGTEIGRQGAFEPYWAQRRPQVMPYDLGGSLRPGRNEISLQIDDLGGGVAALVDSVAVADGGLGLTTHLGWTCARDGTEVGPRLRSEQWLDPRWVCLRPRPHPLPRAAWLEPAAASDGVVVDVVPDAWNDGARTEWLRFVGPAGATRIRVPTAVRFTAVVGGMEVPAAEDGTVTFDRPLPFGTEVCLRFDADGGHRVGGLLAGPLECAVRSVQAPLVEWEALGLRALGGYVSYRRQVEVDAVGADETLVLDLGDVRGSVEVRVNDAPVATLMWSPYRADITSHLRSGTNDVEIVVRGTLAGYLDDASPTPAVYKGQARHGLLGPVRLLRHPITRRATGHVRGS
jgi:hypothetical protein